MRGPGPHFLVHRLVGNSLQIYTTKELAKWMGKKVANLQGVEGVEGTRYSMKVEIAEAYMRKTIRCIARDILITARDIIFGAFEPEQLQMIDLDAKEQS